MQKSSSQPTLLQKLPGGGISVEAPKQNIAAGQAAVFAGLGTWAIVQVRGVWWSSTTSSSTTIQTSLQDHALDGIKASCDK